MARLLSGSPVAAAVFDALRARVAALQSKGCLPTLAILRLGAGDEDLRYERSVIRACDKAGIRVLSRVLPADCAQARLLAEIETINRDADIHGCLLLRPLPEGIDEQAVCEALLPDKDVDGVASGSLAGLFCGRETAFPPCTAEACLEMLDYYGIDPAGKNALVIGRSLVVGKPAALLLLGRDATVTVCHRKTKALDALCRRAELLLVAAGEAGLVDERFTRPDQVILDVGINLDAQGRLCGDVAFDRVENRVAAITPVPDGVGRVTTAILCRHLVEAAERSLC